MPLVSVIIPTRNRSLLLKEAIGSVLAVERKGFDLEVIVVDDGSTDDTAAVVRALPVTYLRAEGIGVSAARNMGIDAAHGEFLAFIDDDDLWLPNNVAIQLSIFDEHPEYGAVMAQTQLTDANRVPYAEPMPSTLPASEWLFEYFLCSAAQLGSIVIRRSVIEDVGKLDPDIDAGEDWEWMLRIARRYPIGVVAQPVVLFRQRLFGDPGYRDEHAEWRNLHIVIHTLRRHTRSEPLLLRLRMQRPIWKRRGWYAALFVQKAQHRLASGERFRAVRCLYYGLRSSPLHLVLIFGRSLRSPRRLAT